MIKRLISRGILVLFCVLSGSVLAQADFPRTPDGKPDLNGIWQALGTAHLDLETHAARPSMLPVRSCISILTVSAPIAPGPWV